MSDPILPSVPRQGGDRRDGPLVALAAAAAFAAAILAIRQHSETTSLGYRLAAAQREGEVLAREAARAERRVAALRAPNAVLERRTTSLRSLDGLAHQPRIPALPVPAPQLVGCDLSGPAAAPPTEPRTPPKASPKSAPNPVLRTSDPRPQDGRRP